MSRFTFVHASDLHLDTPFEDVGRVPSGLAELLRDASLDAWAALVELTVEREAAFLLLAGDLYDGEERGIRAQVRFRRGLERLAERGIAVFIVHGNHDPLDGWSAIAAWPAGVTVFPSHAVTSVPVVRDGRRLATVHGISFPRRDCAENLALRFAPGAGEGVQIGLLHANVGGDAAHPLYAPCTLEDLRGAGMDYWALGHIHQRNVLAAGAPWIVYPGNLQGRSRAASERGAKGAVVVEVEDGEIRAVEFAALDRARFLHLEVDASRAGDGALAALLAEAAGRERAANPGPALLLDAALSGEGTAARPSLERRLGLLEELRRAAAAHRPAVWWIDVGGRPAPPLEPGALVRDDFAAELVRRAERLAAEPGRRSRFLDRCLEPLLQKWVAEVEPGEAERLFHDAERLAFDLLTRNHDE